MVSAPVTRFAPAPTGALHLGHVVNAVYVWGLARARGGRVVLRVEDHDRQRSRREFERQMLDDLDWLGLEADVYPTTAYRSGPCEGRQSERDSMYRAALGPLLDAGMIYGCDCTRTSQAAAGSLIGGERPYPGQAAAGSLIGGERPYPGQAAAGSLIGGERPYPGQAAAGSLIGGERPYPGQAAAGSLIGGERPYPGQAAAGSLIGGERPYPGTCRDRGIALRDGVGWRLRIAPGAEAFDDGLLGPQSQDPSAQCGDLLLRDRLGNWTYQCVAPIDDALQGVTLVIRGQDLLASTGRQIRLGRLIGRTIPAAFVHHPLVMKSPSQKLSKSDGDSGIRDLRAAGWSAADVIGRAAQLAGLTARSSVAAADLPSLFEDSPSAD